MVSESGYRKETEGTRPAGPDALPDVADSIAIPSAAEQLASIATGTAVRKRIAIRTARNPPDRRWPQPRCPAKNR